MPLALHALLLSLFAQGGADEASPTEALARFDALPVLRQAMLVRRIEQHLAASEDPAIRRILDLRIADPASLPEPPPPGAFDPNEWAPGVAPPRTVIPDSDPRHQAVRATMPAVRVLPDLLRAVRYDWRTGQIVRAGKLGWRERFHNFVHGYPPGADEAFARVLAALDRDPDQRKLADYFEHTYANRDGTVYEGITLYEAWYADKLMEMPDVDAIAFAVRIHNDHSFQSPIPGDARRERLYEAIHQAALEHRRYRTMLEAAAAAFVAATPAMDRTYALLVPRFHSLFATHGDDLGAIAFQLMALGSRDALLRTVDRAVVTDDEAARRRDERQAQLAAMGRSIRALAVGALTAEPTPTPARDR